LVLVERMLISFWRKRRTKLASPGCRASSSPVYLSARNEAALKDMASRYEQYLATDKGNVADICFTANVGRYHFNQRLAMAVDSSRSISDNLASFLSGRIHRMFYVGMLPGTRQPRIVFLFTVRSTVSRHGPGALRYQPGFRNSLDVAQS